jgi:hypothetical protein
MKGEREEIWGGRKKRKVPFEFVLDELADLEPWTRPMFGCTAIYVGEKIVLILREKGGKDGDDGVWVATTKEHHASLRRELPSLRSIGVLGKGETGWQVLPVGASDFEESVRAACAMVRAGDPRVGKVPKGKSRTGRKERKEKQEKRPGLKP